MNNDGKKKQMLEKLKLMVAAPFVVGSPEHDEIVQLADLLGVRLRFGEKEVVSQLARTKRGLKTRSISENTGTPSLLAPTTGKNTTKATKMRGSNWLEYSAGEAD